MATVRYADDGLILVSGIGEWNYSHPEQFATEQFTLGTFRIGYIWHPELFEYGTFHTRNFSKLEQLLPGTISIVY